MAYGISVETNAGMINLSEAKSVRLLGTDVITSPSGTLSAPTGAEFIFVQNRGSNNFIEVTLDSGDLVWEKSISSAPNTGVDISVMFFVGGA